VPVLSSVRPENVATPATAATVAVPVIVAEPGFAPIATVTLPVNAGVGLPNASRALTTAPNTDPWSIVAGGCVVKNSAAGAPGVTLNAPLVRGVRPVEVAASV
jgi:hypothetical protein